MISNIIFQIMLLMPAVAEVESNNNWQSVNADYTSFGALQITNILIQDVNKITLTNRYLIEDAHDKERAREIFETYLIHYGIKYFNKTGKIPELEQLARIWNGGPEGWNKGSTLPYWQKINQVLKK